MKGSLQHCQSLLFVCLLILVVLSSAHAEADDDVEGHELVSPNRLEMFVDDLPQMSNIRGYIKRDGAALPRSLTIGMFEKKWRFHRDLPLTRVFAYGTSKNSATVPGPSIEALQGVETRITWVNYLPRRHILPWDPTIPTAKVPRSLGGIPTVVHLHGAITHPASDGNPNAWFTGGFNTTGPTWSQRQCVYPNVQEPGNLWYHDHAMGLTRVNLLVGLLGTYVIRNPALELPLGLPSGDTYDRHLIVFDRSFQRDGSVYLNSTGNNPSIHPQWQPEYFGDVIIVNGKVWPVLRVRRRRYRFRVINASNARFFRFFLSNGQEFVHVGSDSMYLPHPHRTRRFLLAPSEIADVVVDFAESRTSEVILRNNAPYPYPLGDPADEETSGKVMKFVIEGGNVRDPSKIPEKLLLYPQPRQRKEMKRRYVAMYEYQSETMEPTHLYLNGKPYEAPATETPRAGETEVWEVINLTADNHPLHVHLGLFVVAEQRKLRRVEELRGCMMRENDAGRCGVEGHTSERRRRVHEHERGWKNVYKMRPSYLTRILVRFALIGANGSEAYPFDATDEPGYVYHCHILDHEDNEMMRPLKIIK